MSPGNVIASVSSEEEERPILRGRGKRRQEVKGRLVAPVEVVEEHDRRVTIGHPYERLAERLGEGEVVDHPGRWAELGQEHGKVARELSGPAERRGGDPVVRPQCRDDRRVRRPSLIADDTPQDEERTVCHGGLRQARLPDTRLPCYEKEATLSRGRPVEPVAEYSPLSLTSDELDASRHLESVRRLRHGRERPAQPLRVAE